MSATDTAAAVWGVEEPPVPTGAAGNALSTRGTKTRANLLAAAESVFADLGYHDASVVKITEAAGIAQGTFYLYFGSKQELFDEVVSDLNRRVRRAMSEGSERGGSRAERERLGFAGYFRFVTDHPALYRIIRQAEFVSPGAMRDHYERIAAGYIEGLRSAADAGEIVAADAEVLAYALMGVGELVGMRFLVWDGAEGLPDGSFDELMAFVRRGLGAEEQA